MSWQIQCKQHFLKQLYTLNNQLESEETLTWHEDVQMYCWDCMRVRGGVREEDYNECWACMRVKRGAMFCCWMCMRVERGSVRVVRGSVRVVWELLREESVKYSLNPERLDQTKQDGTWPNLMGNMYDQPTWSFWDSVSLLVNRVSETQVLRASTWHPCPRGV